MDMKKMMKQAQKMQLELARAQEEVQDYTFTASAGGGIVEATADGTNTVTSLVISPEAVDPDDVDMLQDLILAAVNEALRGVAQKSEERLSSVTGGMNIPGLF